MNRAGPLSLSASARIAEFVAGFRPSQVTSTERARCSVALADTYAVALAGRREPAAIRSLGYAEAAGFVNGDARTGTTATVWGTGLAAATEVAALCNGIAVHALDYDDSSGTLNGHPSVALWPPLLALGQARALHGERLISAYVVGFEVACQLGRAMTRQYARGWHMTATIGIIAGTAACAHLLALTASQTCHAIGLAVAAASGSQENFGSDAKAFQGGHTGAMAVRAVLLAEQGATSSRTALDGRRGYAALYCDGDSLPLAFGSEGAFTSHLESEGIEIKRYPACYAVQRAVDAALELRGAFGFDLADIEGVHVVASPGLMAPLIRRHPASALEAKFSMEYAVSAALADGVLSLGSFEPEAVRRPGVRALFPKFDIQEAEGEARPQWTSVALRLRDGRLLERRVEALKGSPVHPLSDADLQDKLRDCLAWGRSTLTPPALLQACRELPALPARDLLARLATAIPHPAFSLETL